MNYFLRIRSRNLLGVVAIHASTLASARAIARAWVAGLQGTRDVWAVELVNNEGHKEQIT